MLLFSHSTLLLITLAVVFATLARAQAAESDQAKKCRSIEVRKEWRSFSKAEKTAWISAVNCISKLPHNAWLTPTIFPTNIPPMTTASSTYDDIVYVHMDLSPLLHSTGQFFPWHRWYVWIFTYTLKERCGYKGASPYWDWARDVKNFQGSNWWDPSPGYGLGGWGDPARDYAVPNGGFSKFTLAYPSVHTLRRNFTEFPWRDLPFDLPGLDKNARMESTFSPQQVAAAINGYVGDFVNFQYAVEKIVGMHSSIHVGVGGDHGGTCPANAPPDCVPGPIWSANDPIFFMHHGNIDRIWWLWQNRNKKNFYAFKGGSVANLFNLTEYPNGEPPWINVTDQMPTDGFPIQMTIQEVLNTQVPPLCYTYE